MKRHWVAGLAVVMMVCALWAPAHAVAQDDPACSPDAGTVVTRTIESEALRRSKDYNVYLPPDWCHLDDLPLLVMLHGWSGDHHDWVRQGHLDATADALILAGEIEPLIILMPDGDNSFYVESFLGDYETYVTGELIDAVDAEFPTAGTRDARFIGGLSMGGYGAVYLALRHPDLFSAVGAHSPAFLRQADQAPQWLYGSRGEQFEERDVVTLVARDHWPEDMRLWVDIGASDGLMGGVYDLFGALMGERISEFQAHIWPGIHDWAYWGGHAADYLRFYVGVGEE